VSGFESIIDQHKPIRLLSAFLQKGTTPHALLFTGIEGVGKRMTALTFAMACNCMNAKQGTQHQDTASNPCLRCRSCRKIKSGNHPDIIFIKPSGPFIRINQIRSLCHTLSMKPYEARQRVVILSEAQAMNPEAGNALLKVLEEPPERTLLILTAIQISDLLPTIVSRCQLIRFNPISLKSIAGFLVEKKGIAPDDAMILATLANGSLSKAILMNQADWIKRRNWLIDEIEALPSRSVGPRLAFAERLAKNKDVLADSLEVIKLWLRDLVIYHYDPAKVINRDLVDKIRSAAQRTRVESILSKLDAILSAQKNMSANSNLRLTLEVLTFRLAGG
jgi:DNA polymerase-3 subunit delta'